MLTRSQWEANRVWMAGYGGWADSLRKFLSEQRANGLTQITVVHPPINGPQSVTVVATMPGDKTANQDFV